MQPERHHYNSGDTIRVGFFILNNFQAGGRVKNRLLQLGISLALSALVGLAVPGSQLQAQEPAARAFFDSLLTDLSKAATAGEIPPLTRCSDRTGSVQRLCQVLIGARQVEFSRSSGDANRLRDQAERVVKEEPKWPVGWYGLAMMRVQATRAGVIARDGPLLPLGMSNDYGAGLALARAVTLDPDFSVALEALAVIPLPFEGTGKLSERLEILRANRSKLSALGSYGAGLMELESGNPDSAVIWLRTALRSDEIDRGMVRFTLARTYYQLNQAVNGRPVLVAGAGDTSAASRLAYHQLLSLVASPEELSQWDSLPPAQQQEWFDNFWISRDAEAGLSEGSRLTEHFRRYEYAVKNFPIRELQQGQQSVSSNVRKVDASTDDISVKYFAELRRRIEAATSDTLFPTGLMFAAALKGGEYHAPFHSFRGLRDRLDDRGIVYVRYGAPDKKEEIPDDGGVALWRYDLPDGPMFLSFRAEEFTGNTGATRLVPHLMDLPYQSRVKLCPMQPSLCAGKVEDAGAIASAMSAGGGQANMLGGDKASMGDASDNAAIIRRQAEQGMAAIQKATTGDSYRRTFKKPLHPSVQMLVLDRLSGGDPKMVLAFAIPGSDLEYTTPPEAGGNAVYALNLQTTLIRSLDGKWISRDTTRLFATPQPITGDGFLTGVVEFPLVPGDYTGSVVIGQYTGQGAVVQLRRFTVPENSTRLSISDLVVGRGGGVVWNSGTTRVALNPLGTFEKGADASLYFQLHGLKAGTPYQVSMQLFKGVESDKEALTLEFSETPQADRIEVSRTLDLSTLSTGAYRLVITISGNGEKVSAQGALSVRK